MKDLRASDTSSAYSSFFVIATLVGVVACTTTTTISGPPGGSSATTTDPNATHALGVECVAACGGKPGLDCAVPTTDCGGGWCLVDLKTTGSLRTYCTVDCASTPCPDGFQCGDIDVIGVDGVERACVADPAECGDGVRQSR